MGNKSFKFTPLTSIAQISTVLYGRNTQLRKNKPIPEKYHQAVEELIESQNKWIKKYGK